MLHNAVVVQLKIVLLSNRLLLPPNRMIVESQLYSLTVDDIASSISMEDKTTYQNEFESQGHAYQSGSQHRVSQTSSQQAG